MTRPLIAALAFASISLLLGGCGAWQTNQPVSQISYQSSAEADRKSVGKLRRLAFLALYQRPPRACSTTDDLEVEVSPMIGSLQEMTRFLTTKKGYEIVNLEDDRYEEWISDPTHRGFLKEASEWSAHTSGNARIGPLMRSFIAYVRDHERVDGLLLVHSRDRCSRANLLARALVVIGTVGLAELFPEEGMHGFYQVHDVAIIEAATSSPVWRNSLRTDWNNFRESLRLAPEKRLVSETLFKDIEPAVK